MLNFPRSTFTWKSHPWQPDPYYKYAGGYVGEPGQVRHVRFNLEAKCDIRVEATGQVTELFLGAPCRTEYTIPRRNLFQIPNDEFRMAFSRQRQLTIAKRPSSESEPAPVINLDETFQAHDITLRYFPAADELTETAQIVAATLNHDCLNVRSSYRDAAQGLTVSVEYPVNLINVAKAEAEFQVCTGPVIVPDLTTWDGAEVRRVFLAHVAITAFDFVEFILRREVDVAEAERAWLDQPRGRDRLALHDPANPPPGYPPPRPRPTVYNETWEFEAVNVAMRAENSD